MASYNYGRYYDYDRGERRSLRDEELDQRLLDANRRMEDSSSRCVQVLNETIKMATSISEELELQAESLDRKDNLDKIATNLESSRRNMREVKSIFGSMVNRFTKPKIPSDPPPKKSSVPSSKPSKGASKPTAQVQVQKQSTGNKVVDHNLDQLELGLKQLERQAYLIGSLLDEFNDTLERIRVKMDCNDICIKYVTRDARRSDTLADEMNLREVKSMFGSMVNHFTKPKIPLANKMISIDITTKEYQRTAFSGKARLIMPSSKPSKGASKPTAQVQVQKQSTGNKVVDHNLDQLEFELKQLERQAYLIGSQLDESNDTLERIRVKMDCNDICIKYVTRDARRSDTLADEMNLREVKSMFGSMVNHFTKPQIPLADKMISIDITTKEYQRTAFSGKARLMQSVTYRHPLINSLVQKINLCKRRDSLILGGVIAICLYILLLFFIIT